MVEFMLVGVAMVWFVLAIDKHDGRGQRMGLKMIRKTTVSRFNFVFIPNSPLYDRNKCILFIYLHGGHKTWKTCIRYRSSGHHVCGWVPPSQGHPMPWPSHSPFLLV